jgi:hypothetical protein
MLHTSINLPDYSHQKYHAIIFYQEIAVNNYTSAKLLVVSYLSNSTSKKFMQPSIFTYNYMLLLKTYLHLPLTAFHLWAKVEKSGKKWIKLWCFEVDFLAVSIQKDD